VDGTALKSWTVSSSGYRQWQTLNLSRQQAEEGFPFVTADELLLDPRGGGCYFWATFIPRHLGKGSFYQMGLRDKTGALLDGSSLYRLRVPKEVPAREFWSAVVYSMETKASSPAAENQFTRRVNNRRRTP
jgi:hypothetical protein